MVSSALSVDGDNLKIKPELMIDGTLYHCIVINKLMLVYRDSEKLMHCYEVDDPKIITGVRECASYEDATRFLEKINIDEY